MPHIYNKLVQELSSGRPAVLAAIIRQAGSSPRSLGTKFVVCQDGSPVGSIGGGMLEARVIKAAEGLMGSDTALVLEIPMTGKDVAGTDMICGGNVDVLVQGITPKNTQICKVLKEVLQNLEEDGMGILVTGPLPEKDRKAKVDMLFYQQQGKVYGTIGEDAEVIKFIRQRAASILGSERVYLFRYGLTGLPLVFDPLSSPQTAIIFGGGHISLHLAPLLAKVDFRVVVVDDREDFANRKRFPEADEVVVSDFGDCFDKLSFTPETYCVIVTRGHLHDKTVLENVLIRSSRYVGMIGSRRKRNMIYEALKERGIDPAQLEKVHSPIGLNIGAETPEAIAIAIAAELIQVRANA